MLRKIENIKKRHNRVKCKIINQFACLSILFFARTFVESKEDFYQIQYTQTHTLAHKIILNGKN